MTQLNEQQEKNSPLTETTKSLPMSSKNGL